MGLLVSPVAGMVDTGCTVGAAVGCTEGCAVRRGCSAACGAVGWGSYDDVIAALKTALAGGPYLLGERFTAADVYIGSELRFATMFGAPDLKGERIFDDYVARLSARPAFQRANAEA